MSFSARVHPASLSHTPNRHAGIKLEMNGGGPEASRLGQLSEAAGVLEPRNEGTGSPFSEQSCAPPRCGVSGGGRRGGNVKALVREAK